MTDSSAPPPRWNAGDKIIVKHANYSRGPSQVTTETITRVARKYFYIAKGIYGDEQAFEIATGREKDGQNYYDVAYTPADWDAEQFRGGVLVKIREHKVTWGYQGIWREHMWSTGHLCELLELLERVKANGGGA